MIEKEKIDRALIEYLTEDDLADLGEVDVCIDGDEKSGIYILRDDEPRSTCREDLPGTGRVSYVPENGRTGSDFDDYQGFLDSEIKGPGAELDARIVNVLALAGNGEE